MPPCGIKANSREWVDGGICQIVANAQDGPYSRFNKTLSDVVMKNIVVCLNDGFGSIKGEQVDIGAHRDSHKDIQCSNPPVSFPLLVGILVLPTEKEKGSCSKKKRNRYGWRSR